MSVLILDCVLDNKSLALEIVLYCAMFDASIPKREAPRDNMKHVCVFL